jgi:vacuolar-type H+-ATPase subunit H
MARDEVLRAIKEAEKKASAKLEKANSDASNINIKARGESADIVSAGGRAAEAEAQSLVDAARAAANKAADSVRSDGEEALTTIREQGEKNRSSAVDSVLDTFLAE